jgi:ankyrin repeat protein
MGEGALVAAARVGNVSSVRTILAQGRVPDADAGAALVTAALGDRRDVLRVLLDAKAPLEATGIAGLTALGAAIQHGHLEAARLLLTAGARTGAGPTHWPALHLAACVGHADLIELVLAAGAPVDATIGPDRTTALFLVRTPAAASALLRAGARPDAVRADGATPLIGLATRGLGSFVNSDLPRREPARPDPAGTARVLLDAGARIEARDARKRTALHKAVASLLVDGNAELALLLLERGADPSAPDPQRLTPLRLATDYYLKHQTSPVAARALPVIQALAKAGARDLPDAFGVTARSLAAKKGPPALVEALQPSAR